VSRRAASLLPPSLGALSVVLVAASVVLAFLNLSAPPTDDWGTENRPFVFLVLGLAFSVVGVLVSSRRPGNAVGWICLAIGLGIGLTVFVGEYNVYALQTRPGSLPYGEYAAWVENWIWLPTMILPGTLLVLLFPNGRPSSRRWWWVACLAVAGTTLKTSSEMFLPGPLAETPNVTNPFGVETAGSILQPLGRGGYALLALGIVATALSMVLRFRRARGEEHQQLKWFASAAVVLAIAFLLSIIFPSGVLEDLVALLFAGLPVAAGIAILRHHLYDIDRIINRALVYGTLTAALALVYALSVVALQQGFLSLTGQTSQLAVVASTLAIAALFGPLRRRIQEVVDRSFYRTRYDAARTLEAYSARLRDDADLDSLASDLIGAVHETVRPEHASLWLRPAVGPDRERAAERSR
jgi:uncharacterized membrane protein